MKVDLGVYRRLRQIEGFPALAIAFFFSLIAVGTVYLSMLLLAVQQHSTLAVGGGQVGVYCLGLATGTALQAILLERIGQRIVLQVSSLAYGVGLVGLAVATSHLSRPLLWSATFGVATLAPPAAACLRTRWSSVEDSSLQRAGQSLQSTATELAYVLGPILAAFIARWDARYALAGSGVAAMVGGLLLSRTTGAIKEKAVSRSLECWRHASYRSVVIALAALSASFGFTEVAVVQISHSMSGLILGAWSAGSVLGGVLFGAFATTRSIRSMALILLAITAAAPAALVSSIPLLTVALIVAGCLIAPTATLLFEAVGRTQNTPAAFAWISTTSSIAAAAGTATAGVIATHSGAPATFLAGSAVLLAGAIISMRSVTEQKPTEIVRTLATAVVE